MYSIAVVRIGSTLTAAFEQTIPTCLTPLLDHSSYEPTGDVAELAVVELIEKTGFLAVPDKSHSAT
jgi:hypothetical protein